MNENICNICGGRKNSRGLPGAIVVPPITDLGIQMRAGAVDVGLISWKCNCGTPSNTTANSILNIGSN